MNWTLWIRVAWRLSRARAQINLLKSFIDELLCIIHFADRSATGRFLSGQKGRTVNPLVMPSQVRILSSPPSVFAPAELRRDESLANADATLKPLRRSLVISFDKGCVAELAHVKKTLIFA